MHKFEVRQIELEMQNVRLEATVRERTEELTLAKVQLSQEIVERKKAEAALQGSLAEIRQLTARLLYEKPNHGGMEVMRGSA